MLLFAEEKALRFIRKNNLISEGSKIICGFSGGADSAAMVFILRTLAEEFGLSLVCAHLNHMIRGKEALRDEMHCKAFCEKYGIAFISKSVDVPLLAKKLGISEEDAGRRARYSFFDELAKAYGANLIATAHNLDDNAETVLMHITRGCGVTGLCGIEPKRDNIIRPVLCLSRQEIEAYCAEKGLEFITDSTNLDDRYTRNKYRHKVLPLLKEINPSVTSALSRLASNASDTLSFMQKSVDAINIKNGEISTADFKNADKALYPLILKKMLESAGLNTEITSKSVFAAEKILAGSRESCRADLGGGVQLIKAYGKTKLKNFTKAEKFEYTLKSGEIINLNGFEFSIENKCPTGCLALGLNNVKTVTLRSRRDGDKIVLGGMTRRLKELFINNKIERDVRDDYIIADFDGEPVWVQGFGAADGTAKAGAEKYLVIKHTEGM